MEKMLHWTKKTTAAYKALMACLDASPRLKSMRIRISPEPNPELQGFFMIPGGSLPVECIPDSLSVRAGHLTSLAIDTAGGWDPFPTYTDLMARDHICIRLNEMLPSLRRFHCRMETVCPHILRFNQDDPTALANWPMEEIIINLTLQDVPMESPSFRRRSRLPKDCRSYTEDPKDTYHFLLEGFGYLMRALAGRLKNARMLRIIFQDIDDHLEAPYPIYAHDLCAFRMVNLKPGDPWDAEGTPFEDDEDDNEPWTDSDGGDVDMADLDGGSHGDNTD